MRKSHSDNRRPPLAPGILLSLTALAMLAAAVPSAAQGTAPPTASPTAPAQAPKPADNVGGTARNGTQGTAAQPPIPGAQNPLPAGQGPATPPPTPPSPATAVTLPGPPRPSLPEISVGVLDYSDANGGIRAHGGIEIKYADATVTADEAAGNLNREVVLSGHAKLEARGATSYADAIHISLRNRSYRLDNPHGVLSPEFLQERVLDPVFISGGTLYGQSSGYSLMSQLVATTCVEPTHHYELHIGSAELFPYKRLVLRKVGVVLFGVKLIVLPYLVIPLDPRRPRRPRTDYLPEFGQNTQEGYYVRFPYTFAEGAAAASFLRLDITQKLGEGGRFEQEYLAGKQGSVYDTSSAGGGFTGSTTGAIVNAYGYGTINPQLPRLGTGLGPQNGGLFAMQGYFGEGFNRNFNASFRHQQGIGGDNRFALTTELQRNSDFSFSNQTSENTRFNFNHTDPAHGVMSDITLGLSTTDSTGTSASNSTQLTSSYRQSFDFGLLGANRNNLSYNIDASRSTSDFGGTKSVTEDVDTQFQFQHISRDYTLTAQANKNFNLISQANSGFGTVERLPELQLSMDTLNFKGGLLSQVPAHLDIGVGRYSEPSHNFQDDRVLFNFALQEMPILHGRTEMVAGGGFEQRFYSDGAAQYILRNTVRMRQHLGRRSGIDINYTYAQPEGGTPFLFDTFEHTHNITAEAGYLDDRHFQLTALVGYNFLGIYRQTPFQSLSTRMMWRPTPSVRFDALATYDPNTGTLSDIIDSLRLRARNNFAIDFYTRYDPTLTSGKLGKFTQVNTEFDIPLGRTWRIAGLLLYDGVSGQFQSTNFQITHEWDCLEASLTYSASPLSFTGSNDRQIFFSLRIKALPFFRSFARGPAGEALNAGFGNLQ